MCGLFYCSHIHLKNGSSGVSASSSKTKRVTSMFKVHNMCGLFYCSYIQLKNGSSGVSASSSKTKTKSPVCLRCIICVVYFTVLTYS